MFVIVIICVFLNRSRSLYEYKKRFFLYKIANVTFFADGKHEQNSRAAALEFCSPAHHTHCEHRQSNLVAY